VASGQYGQLQAEMRAVVYDNLVKSGETEEKPNDKRPASCKLVETLIMEYLQWRRCPHTQHIFQSGGLPRLLEACSFEDLHEVEQTFSSELCSHR